MIIGIDVGKDKIDCAWLRDIETSKVKTKVLKNKPAGFKSLIDWAALNTKQPIEAIHFVMEAPVFIMKHWPTPYTVRVQRFPLSILLTFMITEKARAHAPRRIKKTAPSLLVMARLNVLSHGRTQRNTSLKSANNALRSH